MTKTIRRAVPRPAPETTGASPAAKPPDKPSPPAEPRVEITLHPRPAGDSWQAEVQVEGRHLHFPSLPALIVWLARLEPRSGGIR